MSTARCLPLLISLAMASPASAKDLSALSSLLTPAYVAMNYAAVCAPRAQWAVRQPVGLRGGAAHYAAHVKNEVVAGLTGQEALLVLRQAADEARAEARKQLRENVHSDDRMTEEIRLSDWCDDYARHFIGVFIEIHDREHDAFLKQVQHFKSEN